MPLPTSGPLSLSAVNVELGLSANAPLSMGSTVVRTLFGVNNGAIRLAGDGRGKSNRVSVTVTLSTNQINYTLGTAQIPGYQAGTTDVTLVVNSGVYVYSTNTANAGLTIAALAAGDTVSIVNNGFIMGMGGAGNGGNAGPAMNINRAVTITNNSFIAGGGGGGGGLGGGGGAGGGAGGNGGGAGGGPGASGANGAAGLVRGGGGGRILPGVGGASISANKPQFAPASAFPGNGGGAGGGGCLFFPNQAGGGGGTSGSGGSANNPGGVTSAAGACAAFGGGGGWGAAGSVEATQTSFGVGGKAVNLNGHTATFAVTGTRYGAIS